MNAPADAPGQKTEASYDTNFFDAAKRGLEEEFAVPQSAIASIKALSLNVEYLTLSVDVVVLMRVDMTAEAIRQQWLLRARDKNEATKLNVIAGDLPSVLNKLFAPTLWHPTSRMRLIQYLFHNYGVDEVVQAMNARRSAL